MLNLVQNNLVLLSIAMLIGIAVGRWMFARRRAAPDQRPKDSPKP